ncbi:hypothetical protein MSG28_003958 [Choristoneura fumiferana]|uniref:Uncharacterized protein n=1 Tax=Choristoneura fumiferana TaxID=7141 RepID=A0ACC0KGV0_CHOFU|nr:hypothetical protein MSG28_003958 [Choristoneura fumiferana]
MAQIEDHESVEYTIKRSLLAKSKRAIIMRDPNGDTEYCCVECPLKFSDKTLMEQHLSAHNREYRFLCGICGTALKRKEHLDRHTLEHQQVRPHVCPDCGKAFKRKEHLNIHRTIHSGQKNHTCPLCDKCFYRKDHLQKHLQTHSKMFIEQNVFVDAEQDMLDIKPEMLDIKQEPDDAQSMITISGVTGNVFDPDMMVEIRNALSRVKQAEMEPPDDPERPHVCLVCGKRYKRRDHLKLHSVSHMEKDKICLECGKAFRKEEQLRNHMSIHMKPQVALEEGLEPYQMAMETDDYQQEESLLVPCDEPPSRAERPYGCPLCHRRFKRKQHLKVHANVHVRQHPPTIWCSICNEGFLKNEQFEQHQCPGEESTPPPPPLANQENYPAQDYVQMLDEPIAREEPALPTPRRVFVCRYCGKPFKRKDHYRIHLHVHTGVKSFFCTDCGKGFYRKDHLQKHSQVHLKEKPKIVIRRAKKELPELFPIHMLKKPEAQVKPEITITAPMNTKLRVPLQIKVPYQVVTATADGEARAVTVDPARGMRDLLA